MQEPFGPSIPGLNIGRQPQVDESLFDQTVRLTASRIEDPTQRRRLFREVEREEPQLFVLTTKRPSSPILQDAYDNLKMFYEDEAFDFLEGVNTILNHTAVVRDHQAVGVMDSLIKQRHIVRLEEM